ncbi:MAG: hypothetical protein KME06_03895 [Kastovskya adunca ATA6-11-RM4]|nr:hypothetical protein [Kastovskya adunca ATA6-11-RM4]
MDWLWLVIPVLIAVSALWEYSSSRSMFGQAAAKRNLRNSAFWLVLALMLGIAFYFLRSQPWRNSALFGLTILLFAVEVVLCIYWLTWFGRKQQAGSLLLNVGRLKTQRGMFSTGIFFMFLTIMQVGLSIDQAWKSLAEFSPSHLEISLFLAIFFWASALNFLIAGASRLELRENGICYLYSIIRWKKIGSYQWEGKRSNTLTLWLKQRFLFFQTKNFPIPPTQKETIKSILEQNLSGSAEKMESAP